MVVEHIGSVSDVECFTFETDVSSNLQIHNVTGKKKDCFVGLIDG